MLYIDWSTIALDEKDIIFFRLAEYNKPEFFITRDDLQIRIARNIKRLSALK